MEEPLKFSWVKPRIPTERESMFISTMDTFARKLHYNRRVIFYRVPSTEYAAAIDHLKRSLSDVLIDFYPAAGRLAVGEDGRISIDCNDEGVEFVETVMHQVSMEDLETDNFQMQPVFNELVRWESYSSDGIYGIPLLSVQVTQFKCGTGIALGVAHSHILADGYSLWHFMKSWAECGRGVPISIPPVHRRTDLKVDNPSEKMAYLSFEDMEGMKGRIGELKEGQVMVQRVFHFSTDKIERLKSEAKGRYTTYEVVCAHIWRCVTRARGNKETETVCFINAADFRGRMKPALGEGYFGNALIWGVARTTAGEMEGEELGGTAARMKESIRGNCNDERVRGLLHWMELKGVDKMLEKLKLDGKRMRVSSSPRFPVYEVDFGWGKPLAARSAKVEEDGKIVMFPGREGGGSIDACMALLSDAMEKLQADPSFLD